MSRWNFRSTFCAVGLGLGHDPEGWSEAVGSLNTDFTEDPSAVLILFHESAQCSLLVEPVGERFGLSWEVRSLPRRHEALIPCIVPDEMDVFDYTAHEEAVPRGSLVDRGTAAALVRAFLEDPESPPDDVPWASRFDIEWPEP